MLVDLLLDMLTANLARVANCDELHVGLLEHPVQVIFAAASDPDARDDDALAGCDRATASERFGRNDGRHEARRPGCGRCLENFPPIQSLGERSITLHRMGSPGLVSCPSSVVSRWLSAVTEPFHRHGTLCERVETRQRCEAKSESFPKQRTTDN